MNPDHLPHHFTTFNHVNPLFQPDTPSVAIVATDVNNLIYQAESFYSFEHSSNGTYDGDATDRKITNINNEYLIPSSSPQYLIPSPLPAYYTEPTRLAASQDGIDPGEQVYSQPTDSDINTWSSSVYYMEHCVEPDYALPKSSTMSEGSYYSHVSSKVHNNDYNVANDNYDIEKLYSLQYGSATGDNNNSFDNPNNQSTS